MCFPFQNHEKNGFQEKDEIISSHLDYSHEDRNIEDLESLNHVADIDPPASGSPPRSSVDPQYDSSPTAISYRPKMARASPMPIQFIVRFQTNAQHELTLSLFVYNNLKLICHLL